MKTLLLTLLLLATTTISSIAQCSEGVKLKKSTKEALSFAIEDQDSLMILHFAWSFVLMEKGISKVDTSSVLSFDRVQLPAMRTNVVSSSPAGIGGHHYLQNLEYRMTRSQVEDLLILPLATVQLSMQLNDQPIELSTDLSAKEARRLKSCLAMLPK